MNLFVKTIVVVAVMMTNLSLASASLSDLSVSRCSKSTQSLFSQFVRKSSEPAGKVEAFVRMKTGQYLLDRATSYRNAFSVSMAQEIFCFKIDELAYMPEQNLEEIKKTPSQSLSKKIGELNPYLFSQ